MAKEKGIIAGAITGPSITEETWAVIIHGFTNHTDAAVVRPDGIGYAATVHTNGPVELSRLSRKSYRRFGPTHAIGGDRTIQEVSELLVQATGRTVAIESRGGRNLARPLRSDEPDPAA